MYVFPSPALGHDVRSYCHAGTECSAEVVTQNSAKNNSEEAAKIFGLSLFRASLEGC